MIWPSFLILLSIMFHVQFFAGKSQNPGILVPGGLLLIYGSLFLYSSISRLGVVGDLWPIFLVGPGFGLMELKLFSKGKEGSWIPVIILFSLAVFFLFRERIDSSSWQNRFKSFYWGKISSKRRSYKSLRPIPKAWACWGTMLLELMPGTVLTSRNQGLSSFNI